MQLIIKPRYELTNYRKFAGLTILQLAEEMKVDEETVRRWEAGLQDPHAEFVKKLCRFFNVGHPKELNLDAQFNAPAQSREEFLQMLRREALEYIGAASIVAGVDPVAVLHATIDDPNEFLQACRVVLNECWDLHDLNSYALADNIIKTLMPGLRELAMKKSAHQHEAASLAIEAKVLQIIIASRKQDYKRRISLGSDIILIGKTSGDKNLHAMAIGWHGNTYINCYHQPETAIAVYNSAIPHLDSVSPLNKSDIYMGLATASALDQSDTDEEATKARDYVVLARTAMPDDPESDPLYKCILTGPSELDQREGNMYLTLAKRFPANKDYGQWAFAALVKSTSQEAMGMGYRSQALINQADAARCIKDMTHYFECLEKGLHLALQIGSDKEITHAIAVLQTTPRRWRYEQRYKDLDAIVREIMNPTKIRS